jgi:hypothetical protein
MVAPLALNLLPIGLLLASVAEPTSIVRADLHLISSVLVLVVNILIAVGLFIIWFVATDTAYSGGIPFNDYRWPCVFQLNITCSPAVSFADLSANVEFWLHFALALAFLVSTVVHLILNRLIRTTGLLTASPGTKTADSRYFVAAYLILGLLPFLYWAAVPLVNTAYVHGYPRFALPPSPNTFESNRYGLQYWLVAILALNVVPFYTLAMALVMSTSRVAALFNMWLTIVVAILSFVVGVFLVIGLIQCSGICSSYQWCCEFFASQPRLCSNVTPCFRLPGPASLAPNAEYVSHIVAAFLYAVIHGIGVIVQFRAQKYSLIKNKSD